MSKKVGTRPDVSRAPEIMPKRSVKLFEKPTGAKLSSEYLSQRSKKVSSVSCMIFSRIGASSASSESRIDAGRSSFSKLALTGSEKKESIVLICAFPSLISCFWRWILSGCSAIASERAFAIFALSSPAAARVKVTIRSLERS